MALNFIFDNAHSETEILKDFFTSKRWRKKQVKRIKQKTKLLACNVPENSTQGAVQMTTVNWEVILLN